MKRLSFLIALMIFLNWSGPARAEPDIYTRCLAKTASVKGMPYNKFRAMIRIQKNNFVTAWLSGAHYGLSNISNICSSRIAYCYDSATEDQRLAMLEKKANESPEKWNADHKISVYLGISFVGPCLRGEIPFKKKK